MKGIIELIVTVLSAHNMMLLVSYVGQHYLHCN